MTLRQLKEAVAVITAPNLRLAGFCNDYGKMHDEHQLQVDAGRHRVVIVNTHFVEGLPVFGASQTKARILSMPQEYDDYGIMLRGVEEAGSETVCEKRIVKAQRLDDPTDWHNAGLCLLGPAAHKQYEATVVFADMRASMDSSYVNIDFSINDAGEAYIHKAFDTPKGRELFVGQLASIIDQTVGDRIELKP